jgi:cell division protein FtsN
VAVIANPSRSTYLRSYRVAVGSFTAPSRAEKLASSLRRDGLPARAIRTGRNLVVVIGPYKTQSQAQAAFDQVKTAHSDAILFRPNGSKLRANASATIPTTPATTSTIAPETLSETNTTPIEDSTAMTTPEAISSTPVLETSINPATPSEKPQAGPATAQRTPAAPAPLGRYLQVGAFKDIASASPVLAKLARFGYRGTLDQGSDGLTRVLVGPYDTKTFERAKRNLRNRGFRVFAAK